MEKMKTTTAFDKNIENPLRIIQNTNKAVGPEIGETIPKDQWENLCNDLLEFIDECLLDERLKISLIFS